MSVTFGAVQGTGHFPNIFCNGSYIGVPLEVWDELESQQAFKARISLNTQPFIEMGENLGSPRSVVEPQPLILCLTDCVNK